MFPITRKRRMAEAALGQPFGTFKTCPHCRGRGCRRCNSTGKILKLFVPKPEPAKAPESVKSESLDF
jgi:Ribonuclease G/E